jgi:hypothetical protein
VAHPRSLARSRRPESPVASEGSNNGSEPTLHLADATIQAKLNAFVARSSRQWRERSHAPAAATQAAAAAGTAGAPAANAPAAGTHKPMLRAQSMTSVQPAPPPANPPTLLRARSTSTTGSHYQQVPGEADEDAPPQLGVNPPADDVHAPSAATSPPTAAGLLRQPAPQ